MDVAAANNLNGNAFDGTVADTIKESTPSWLDYRRPGPGAPNILLVVLDDVGFGHLGRYGGSISTPAMDSIGEAGLSYTNFHVTSLCSTTRASLMTGRNHHSVGMGFLAGFDSGYPSYRGRVELNAATIPRMLREEGYGTYALGKWHMTPPSDMSPAGPFQYWPIGQGFDRYYGFLWGEDDQWSPQLWEDNHFVDPPRTANYHLSADLADHARTMISDHVSAEQDRPFFMYLAFGAAHAPHQAPRQDIDRYRGRFEHGWDHERDRVLSRQIASGIVPQDTKLAPRNEDVAAWDTLSQDQRRLYCRLQEAFAGFLDHTDQQVARVLSFIDDLGLTQNTVVIVMSDNGASGEGGPDGSVNEYRYFMSLEDSFDYNLSQIDEIGGTRAHNQYPAGWGQAGNTPLRYYKKFNYGGGVRAPLMIRWPAGIAARGKVREQFSHVTDILPTLLDLAGVEPLESYDGHAQMPIHGHSLEPTFTSSTATAVDTRRQYFEIAGHRGLWSDGWKIVTNHCADAPYDADEWKLFDLRNDFSECNDISAERPDLVAALDDAWWQEARRYGVLPLDDRTQDRALDRGPLAARRHFRLLPGTRAFTTVSGPNWGNRSFKVTAHIERESGDDGVLVAFGRRAAGFSLYIRDERLVLEYNCAGDRTTLVSASRVPVGVCDIDWTMRNHRPGRATATLAIGRQVVARGPVQTMVGGYGQLATQVGHNAPSPVSDAYEPPFTFQGALSAVEVNFLDEDQVTDDLGSAIGFE